MFGGIGGIGPPGPAGAGTIFGGLGGIPPMGGMGMPGLIPMGGGMATPPGTAPGNLPAFKTEFQYYSLCSLTLALRVHNGVV